MNSKQKGSNFEREVQVYLESQGWAVFRVHLKPMWIRDKATGKMRLITVGADIFGCDIVARKPGRKTRYIQVSVDGRRAEKEAQMREHPLVPETEDNEIWLRIAGKKAFRVWKAVIGMGTMTGQAIVFEEQPAVGVKVE